MTNDQREPFCQVVFNNSSDTTSIDIRTLFRDQAKPPDISEEKIGNNDLRGETAVVNSVKQRTAVKEISSTLNLQNSFGSQSIQGHQNGE